MDVKEMKIKDIENFVDVAVKLSSPEIGEEKFAPFLIAIENEEESNDPLYVLPQHFLKKEYTKSEVADIMMESLKANKRKEEAVYSEKTKTFRYEKW